MREFSSKFLNKFGLRVLLDPWCNRLGSSGLVTVDLRDGEFKMRFFASEYFEFSLLMYNIWYIIKLNKSLKSTAVSEIILMWKKSMKKHSRSYWITGLRWNDSLYWTFMIKISMMLDEKFQKLHKHLEIHSFSYWQCYQVLIEYLLFALTMIPSPSEFIIKTQAHIRTE